MASTADLNETLGSSKVTGAGDEIALPPKRHHLPESYYAPRFSDLTNLRTFDGIRGLLPFELIPGMISLAPGKPNPETFPIMSLSFNLRSPTDPRMVIPVSLGEEELQEALQYTLTRGISSYLGWVTGLQEVSHGRRSQEEGWSCAAGMGSQDLLYKAFHAMMNPGDSIFVEAPVYAGILTILQSLRADMIEIPTDSKGLRTSQLRTTLQNWPSSKPIPKLLYTVPYGCNPSGITVTLERRLELLALAREYDFIILEDDPYFYLYYGDAERPPSYFDLEARDPVQPFGRVVRFDSFSKILSAGLRLGFVSAPEPIIDAINRHTSTSNLQVASTTQAIGYALLNTLGYDGFIAHTRRISEFYKQKRDVFEAAMRRRLGELAEWSTPESGMFFWFKLKLRPTKDAPDGDSQVLIAQRAFAKKVLAIPGASFYPNSRKTPYVRAAFSLLPPDQVNEALGRLAEVLEEYNKETDDTQQVDYQTAGQDNTGDQ